MATHARNDGFGDVRGDAFRGQTGFAKDDGLIGERCFTRAMKRAVERDGGFACVARGKVCPDDFEPITHFDFTRCDIENTQQIRGGFSRLASCNEGAKKRELHERVAWG